MSSPTSPASSLSSSALEAWQLHILSVLLPLSTAITGIGTIYYAVRLIIIPTDRTLINTSNFILILAYCLGFGVGWLALRLGKIRFAITCMLITGGLGFFLAVVGRPFLYGLDLIGLIQFLVFGAVLVLVAIFAGPRLLVGATALINITTIICVLIAAPLHPSVDIIRISGLSPSLILAVLIFFEWIIAAFLIAQRVAYQQAIQDLRAAYDQARRLDDLKDQFIAHINHELRNPVMTLRGAVEYLLVAREHMSDAEQEETLQRALRTGDSLTQLLERILDIRTIEGEEILAPRPVLVSQALSDALALINPLDGRIAEREFRVTIPADLAVAGDLVRVQQILANLLSNALKYTPDSAPIEVAARIVNAAGRVERRPAVWPMQGRTQGHTQEMIEISVRDYGPGIPPDQLLLLFRRFVRLPRDLGTSISGSGLGLYLCRLFAEAMGGEIWAESTGVPGEGTTFHLRLPRASADSPTSGVLAVAAATLASQAAPRLQPTRVIVSGELVTPIAALVQPLVDLAVVSQGATAAPYLIPNDLGESQRLDFQHFVMREAFQGNHLAPIGQPCHILDVATGTGRWAVELAREFPDAEVVGIDIVQPTAAYAEPDLPAPANYHFQLGNVLDGLPFPDHTFDYVHLRFISAGLPIARWPGMVQELARVTMPGGWIELMEAMPMEGGGPAVERLLSLLLGIGRARGMETLKEAQLGTWLREAGCVDVVGRTEPLPFGTTKGRLGHYIALDIFTGIRNVGAGLAKAGGIAPEAFDQLVREADEEVHSGHYQCVLPIYIAYGCLPAESHS